MSETQKKGVIDLLPLEYYEVYTSKVKTPVQNCSYTLDEAVNAVGYGPFQHKLLFLSGLSWAADAFEVMVLSIIGQIIACEWQIYRWQLALLTSCVFVGMIVGSPIFGVIADKYGRKKAITLSLAFVLVFGVASALSPSYYWMLVFRSCTGIGLSGLPQGLTLCCEYFPTNIRGKAGFYLCYFWSIGTVLIVVMSWIIMEQTRSWRLLLIATAIPSLIVILSLKNSAESARYYMVSDKYEKAKQVVERLARVNGKILPPGHLQMIEKCDDRGCISDLFTSTYMKSTLLFCYIMAASSFTYYGVAFMSPIIVQSGNLYNMDRENDTVNLNNFGSLMSCNVLTRQNYIDLLWTSAAELPGVLLFTISIEKCRRKTYLCVACLTSAALVFLLLLKTNKKIIILLLLFAARGILVAVFQLVYVMISESFPTTLRAVAMGIGGTSAKIGGLVNSYVSQVLIIGYPIAAICILGGAILISGIAAIFLPFETRGMVLLDSHIKRKNLNGIDEVRRAEHL